MGRTTTACQLGSIFRSNPVLRIDPMSIAVHHETIRSTSGAQRSRGKDRKVSGLFLSRRYDVVHTTSLLSPQNNEDIHQHPLRIF